MGDALANAERALILAPAQLSQQALGLLDQAGIQALAAASMDELGRALEQGVGLAIIAAASLNGATHSALHQYLGKQPPWSDLPVVLLTAAPTRGQRPPQCPDASLGNLFLLQCPFESASLVALAQSSLRARRRQYQARNQNQELERQQHLQQVQRMEAIGQLAGGVAHDFNNLLTGIGGSLELMSTRVKQGRTDALPGLLSLSQEAVKRATRLTHQLLAFSSRQSLDAQPVQLGSLLDARCLSPVLSPQITVQMQIDSDLWPVEADPTQLREALDNLLNNAREAMPNGGRLVVSASNQHLDSSPTLAAGDYVLIRLHDTGCGMAQSTLERAFDPFFTTKPTGQGTGLGLSMVYGFSKQSQGHVQLHSRIGHGTQVDVYLPRYDRQPAPSAPGHAQATSTGAPANVLIVEDDATVRLLVQQALDEQGYLCKVAADANAALAIFQAGEPVDLLVSDVGLPGMNGRQLAEIARTLRPALQVLFITGFAETAVVRNRFLDPGMQMLCKPFEFAQLTATVAQMLGKGRRP
ncbi:ATP-binding protein [Pseudomonas rubra]|uniref:histidine kinase n=1 Tax=Pseudomonas rubra TaxID=2942627 RepID=A0ABT5PA57_9PSED|nr:ATP-binding protein [Pseudomonas rubra]MDD1015158.1 ATP-binding protein [Pseudomonas rubra]MDD1037737.1 ATP-binding protein [Pseudomonas rubra]MDD1157343.1 ATP-binding protein [Pseudomonas rubra]